MSLKALRRVKLVLEALLVVALGTAVACGPMSDVTEGEPNVRPAFLGEVKKREVDGITDDLLTGGLGRTGLASPQPPSIATPDAPTTDELRRLAIWANYRAIIDTSPNGGFGVLYGPGVGGATDGKVAGTEYLAYADDGTGQENVALMVQVPATFDVTRPCVVAAPSSGSRGVYGAIGSSGAWGLGKGCAVAYADKGTGSGVHELETNRVILIDGARADADRAGNASSFTARLSATERAAFLASAPHRVAVKHAHSQQNPERTWGRDTLNAVRFAFYVLNEQLGERSEDGTVKRSLQPENTLVIAASVSNGGGAALAALEQDEEGLIDGLAVAEPNVALAATTALSVRRGAALRVGSGRPLFDYLTFANLYQPCAALAPRAEAAPGMQGLDRATAANRCASLKERGLLSRASLTEQADEALETLLAGGWEPESVLLHASHYSYTPGLALTYASAYARAAVQERLCGFSYGGVDAQGRPAPLTSAQWAQMFGAGNGAPPTNGVQIINDLDPTGPRRDTVSNSPSTGVADLNLDGALCLRALWTNSEGAGARVQGGVAETLRSGNLRGRPAIIVHGRSDGLVPPALTSRPYFGQNRLVEGAASKLSYVEVLNAQHFDTLIDHPSFPGYDTRFIPIVVYFAEAADRVFAHLTTGEPLPPSQVVRTTPRGGTPGAAPPLTAGHLPPMALDPVSGDRIEFASGVVTIPD